jgi:hypothetical protein
LRKIWARTSISILPSTMPVPRKKSRTHLESITYEEAVSCYIMDDVQTTRGFGE